MKKTITLAVLSLLFLITGVLIGNVFGYILGFAGGYFGAKATINYINQ